MAKLRGSRNNTLAGLLVVLAVVGTLGAVILLGGALEVFGKRELTVRFPIEVGVGGLVAGSPVLVGGLQAGSVTEVAHVYEGGQMTGEIDVVIAIDERIELREGVRAQLIKPLVGGLSSINFASLGDASASALDGDDVIPGIAAPPGVLASAGYGEREAEAVRELIAAATEGSQNFRDITGRFRNEVLPPVTNTVADAERRWPLWAEDFGQTLSNARATAERAPTIAEEVELTLSSFRDFGDRAATTIESNGRTVDEALGTIQTFVQDLEASRQHAEAFLDRLNNQLGPQAAELFESAQEATERGASVLERAEAIVGEQSPQIRRTLANFRLMSDEARFMAAEVRRSPWRLLYRPDTRELEFELLYESARSYANAVSDLRAATESLEAVLSADNPRIAAEGANVGAMLAEIGSAVERFEQAERVFVDRLIDEGREGE